jgi:hypothetical protein
VNHFLEGRLPSNYNSFSELIHHLLTSKFDTGIIPSDRQHQAKEEKSLILTSNFKHNIQYPGLLMKIYASAVQNKR